MRDCLHRFGEYLLTLREREFLLAAHDAVDADGGDAEFVADLHKSDDPIELLRHILRIEIIVQQESGDADTGTFCLALEDFDVGVVVQEEAGLIGCRLEGADAVILEDRHLHTAQVEVAERFVQAVETAGHDNFIANGYEHVFCSPYRMLKTSSSKADSSFLRMTGCYFSASYRLLLNLADE